MGRNSKDNSMLRRNRLTQIAREYFNALRMQNLKYYTITLRDSGSSKTKTIQELCLYISRVEMAFAQLDEIEKTMINNEFFFVEDAYWWIDKYPSTTFYRLKNIAVTKFLKIWDEINQEE